jgi:DDE superfamily endonuclease
MMIVCNATGSDMLQPFLIYKDSANQIDCIFQKFVWQEGYPPDVQFAVQKADWMDEEMMLKWVEKVWRPSTLAKGGQMTYLLQDAC